MGEPRAVVIGAGMGGLSAAIALAASGVSVTVLEQASEPGGKAGVVEIDGVRCDTGPSVLTLPEVFDELFAMAGTTLADQVELVHPDPAARYRWPDGTAVDLHVHLPGTLASVREALGAGAEAELASYMEYAGRIWRAAEPRFVRGPAPSVWSLFSPGALRDVLAIDPLRSMEAAIRSRVRNRYVRDILLRFATYAGSDPRRAPATLSCIAHVELALGGFGVAGGIGALVDALVRTAVMLGVDLQLDEPVDEVRVERGRVVGVRTAGGRTIDARIVVSNAESRHLLGALLPGRPTPPHATSTSGWNAIVAATRQADRAGHTVLFPEVYDHEFRDLFDRSRTPEDPAIYACAQAVTHRSPGWPGEEPLFVMVNTPPVPDGAPEDGFHDLEAAVHRRLVQAGLVQATDPVRWRRTPRGLARRFPGSGGALYGRAHDGPFAALGRPGNRVRGVHGLYVASGSAHPGGGLPLAALSGRAAAAAAQQDRH